MKKMGFSIEGGGEREKESNSEYYSKGNSPSKSDESHTFSINSGQGQYNNFPKTNSAKNSISGKSYPSSPSHYTISAEDAGISVTNSNGQPNSIAHWSITRHGNSVSTASMNAGSILSHMSKSSKINLLHLPISTPQNHHQDVRHSRSPTAATLMENAEHLQQIEAMAGLMGNNINSTNKANHIPASKSDHNNMLNGKLFGPNVNGPNSTTPCVPTNESELQLYRVLQRANLLRYFDVMIELGGDDVQQLCEAGEEEFLEIMALIGMASKPLHVRRLQKALQEWMTQPSLFQAMYYQPALPFSKSALPADNPYVADISESQAQLSKHMLNQITKPSKSHPQNKIPIRPIAYHSGSPSAVPTSKSSYIHTDLIELKNSKLHYLRPSETLGYQSSSNSNSPTNNISAICTNNLLNIPSGNTSSEISKSPNHSNVSNGSSHSSGSFQIPSITIQRSFYDDQDKDRDPESMRISADQIIPSHFLEQRIRTRSEPNSPSPSVSPRPSVSPLPFLQDVEVQKISEAAMKLIQTLPTTISEPKISARKKSCEDFETVIRVPENDPRRIEEIRKYAAIYGRYDCKRKLQKPLTLNEFSINEAAAQLCKHIPALLTRRDELFPLARQVVRDSGLPYCTTNSANLSISTIPAANTSDNLISNSSIPEDNTSHCGYNGFKSKRLRVDVRGIEIHEYNRPPSNGNVSTYSEDSLQIPNSKITSTPNSPSPSCATNNNQLQIISPHERVTITSIRKKSITSLQPPESSLSFENGNIAMGRGGGISHSVKSLTNNENSDKANYEENSEGKEEIEHRGTITVKIEPSVE